MRGPGATSSEGATDLCVELQRHTNTTSDPPSPCVLAMPPAQHLQNTANIPPPPAPTPQCGGAWRERGTGAGMGGFGRFSSA
eukprot:366515-Chlamydomonas_euryale.AAC.5